MDDGNGQLVLKSVQMLDRQIILGQMVWQPLVCFINERSLMKTSMGCQKSDQV